MSLATRLLIGERFGLLLDLDQLGKLLGDAPETLRNKHHAGTLGFAMTKKGGRLVAHYEDVADYVDTFRVGARAVIEEVKP
jgi:hypothetical protein